MGLWLISISLDLLFLDVFDELLIFGTVGVAARLAPLEIDLMNGKSSRE